MGDKQPAWLLVVLSLALVAFSPTSKGSAQTQPPPTAASGAKAASGGTVTSPAASPSSTSAPTVSSSASPPPNGEIDGAVSPNKREPSVAELQLSKMLSQVTGLPEAPPEEAPNFASYLARVERIHALVATVPDPHQSHMALYFDQSLEMLVAAAAETGFVKDRFFLPWSPTEMAQAADAPQSQQTHDVGLMLFRTTNKQDKLELLIVFLVGESPALGVQRSDLHLAFELARAVSTAKAQLSVLGPYFSGSAYALGAELDSWLRETKKAAKDADSPSTESNAPSEPSSSARVVTGTATASSIDRYFPSNAPLLRTVSKDNELLKFLWDELEGEDQANPTRDEQHKTKSVAGHSPTGDGWEVHRWRHGRRLSAVLLAEEGTVYGHATQDPADGRQHDTPNKFSFPLHISRVGAARARASQNNPTQNVSLRQTLKLRLDSIDETESDTPPLFSNLTPSELELSLRQLLMRICSHDNNRYVVMVATDPTDVLFLGEELHRFCPELVPVTLGSDLLYTHPDVNASLSGMLLASNYPLLYQNRTLAPGDQELSFPNQPAQGFYNAALGLMGELRPPCDRPRVPELAGYHPPDVIRNSKQKNWGPQLWLTVMFDGSFWPLASTPAKPAYIPNWVNNTCPATSKTEKGTDASGEGNALENVTPKPNSPAETSTPDGSSKPNTDSAPQLRGDSDGRSWFWLRTTGTGEFLFWLFMTAAVLQLTQLFRLNRTRAPRHSPAATPLKQLLQWFRARVALRLDPLGAPEPLGTFNPLGAREALGTVDGELARRGLYRTATHLAFASMLTLALPFVMAATASRGVASRGVAQTQYFIAKASPTSWSSLLVAVLAVALTLAAIATSTGPALVALRARFAQRDRSWSLSSQQWYALLTTALSLSLVWLLWFASMCTAYGWWHQYNLLEKRNVDAYLLFARGVDPLGMSPLVPLFFLAGALYLWGFLGLWRVRTRERFTSLSPLPHKAHARGLRASVQQLQNPNDMRLAAWQLLVVVLLGVPLYLFAQQLQPTFESSAFDVLLCLGLGILFAVIASCFVRALLLWRGLRHALNQIMALPMLDAADRIAVKVSSSFGLRLAAKMPNPEELALSVYSLKGLASLAQKLESGLSESPDYQTLCRSFHHITEHLEREAYVSELESLLLAASSGHTSESRNIEPALVGRRVHNAFFGASAILYKTLEQIWALRAQSADLQGAVPPKESTELLPGGKRAGLPTAVLLMGAVPEQLYIWTRMAEDFVMMRLATFVVHQLERVRFHLLCVWLGGFMFSFTIDTYPIQPMGLVKALAGMLVAVAGLGGLFLVIATESDNHLRRLSGAQSGHFALKPAFIGRLFTYALLPTTALVASIDPDVGNFLFFWLAPLGNLLQ